MKVVANSRFVSKVIKSIIEEHGADGADFMIIMDNTGSMSDDIKNIKVGLDQILTSMEEYEDIRLAVATYGDRWVDGDKWYRFKSFENDFKDTRAFLESITVTGGGDYPESVYDGVYNTFNENFWQSDRKRIAILLGDAPSLVDDLSKHNHDEIIEAAKSEGVNMNLYPIVLSPYSTEYGSPESMQSLSFIESIYPNPSKGVINVSFNQINDLELEIFDKSGKSVKKASITGENMRLDLYDLENGLYVIRVLDAKKNYDIKKFVLTR